MVLKIENVEKSFADSEGVVPVLRGVSLALEAGETLALRGESGSGKSTLLHIAAALEEADSGHVWVSGRDLTTLDDRARAALRRSEISLVFQQFNLIPSLNVAQNIAFQSALSGDVDQAHIDRVVGALGLTSQLGKYPEALSGGQQQRVAIARAIAAKPKLMLADEPTGNLDEQTAEDVLNQMLDLVAQTGTALMVVTHSPALAARMDRQVLLKNGRLA